MIRIVISILFLLTISESQSKRYSNIGFKILTDKKISIFLESKGYGKAKSLFDIKSNKVKPINNYLYHRISKNLILVFISYYPDAYQEGYLLSLNLEGNIEVIDRNGPYSETVIKNIKSKKEIEPGSYEITIDNYNDPNDTSANFTEIYSLYQGRFYRKAP